MNSSEAPNALDERRDLVGLPDECRADHLGDHGMVLVTLGTDDDALDGRGARDRRRRARPLLNDDLDRLRCVDLVRAGRTQEGLDLHQVVEDEIAILAALPVVVRRPRRDAPKEHFRRRTEKNHGIESRVEPPLVRDRPGDVERRAVLPRKKLGDALLAPDVAAVGVRPLTPAPMIGVDDCEAPLLELCEGRGLARARHSRQQDPAHGEEASE